jgi:hypothetical protein
METMANRSNGPPGYLVYEKAIVVYFFINISFSDFYKRVSHGDPEFQ